MRRIGNDLEKSWARSLAKAEGGCSYQTVASGAIFNDEDVKSDMHICQCKATTLPKKTLSISMSEFDSTVALARKTWRKDGRGMKVGLVVQERADGRIIVSLDSEDYLGLIEELVEYRDLAADMSEVLSNLEEDS
jgi:hypothetical protein